MALRPGETARLTAEEVQPSYKPVSEVSRVYSWGIAAAAGSPAWNQAVEVVGTPGGTIALRALGQGRVTVSAKAELTYCSAGWRPRNEQLLAGSWTLDTGTCQVRLDLLGRGSVRPESCLVFQGLRYGQLPAPAAEGLVFGGWYTRPRGGEAVTAETEVTRGEDHTLYARWTRRQDGAALLAVSFDTQRGGMAQPESRYRFPGEPYGALPEVRRSGYTFDGWYTRPREARPSRRRRRSPREGTIPFTPAGPAAIPPASAPAVPVPSGALRRGPAH